MTVTSRLWLVAIVVAAAGTLLVYEAHPGLNWGIWTTMAAAGLVYVMRGAQRPLSGTALLLAVLAALVGWSAAFTSSEFFHVLHFVAIVVLLSLSALVAAGVPLQAIGAIRMALAPPTAWLFGLVEVVRRKAELFGLLRTGHSAQAVRGVIMAVPVLVVFTVILSGADPVFAKGVNFVGDVLHSLTFLDRVIVFGVFGTVTLGGYGLALRGALDTWSAREQPPRPLFSDMERIIVLGSVVSLFALFCGLQVAYLFGDVGGMRGSGVTYAEHARRGFGELTVAATLGALLLLGLQRWRAAGPREWLARLLSIAVIVELHLLLESALRRVHLYEAAYGFTTDRLYARIYMGAVSVALLLLAWELWHGLDVRRLARRCAAVAVAFLLVLTVWNHEAWVATKNIERSVTTGKLDVQYLGRGFSLDAAPAITDRLHLLPAEQQATVLTWLAWRHHQGQATAQRHWWEWNARRRAGLEALAAAGVDLTNRPDAKVLFPEQAPAPASTEPPPPR